MIRPRPQGRRGRSRAVAVGMTVALLLCARAGLRGLPVPPFTSGRELIRELDPLVFARYSAPEAFEASPRTREEEAPEEPDELRSLDDDVRLAMEELERRFGSTDIEAALPEPSRGVSEGAEEGIDEADARTFGSLFGERLDRLPTTGVGGAGARGRSERGARPPGLGIAEGIGWRGDRSDPPAAPRPSVAVEVADRATGEAEPAEVVIREYESDRFAGSEVERLATWMRSHGAELPIGVRVHLRHQPSFLTASVPLSARGRDLELFLMFNESLRELHIVLVEEDRSVYLIDRGFQERSRSLREGTVRRSNGEIVSVDSRSGAASGERAREFYNIFLSWWETARQHVDAP